MGNYNEISEVKLYEGSSLQGWGANEMTPITGIKSFEDTNLLMDNILNAIKNGKYTDETFAKLELQLLQLHKQLQILKEASVETQEPSEDKSTVTVTISLDDTQDENPMEEEEVVKEEVKPEEMPDKEMAEEMEFEALLNNLLEDYTNGKS